MEPAPSHFKPEKESIVDTWDTRADQWDSWSPITDAWFAPATEMLLRHLALRPGDAVLELAAGTGGLTKHLARAVGAKGSVVATDSGPNMVALAERNARKDGLSMVSTRVMDGEHPDLPSESVDAVACRQGVMFFEQPAVAFQRLREVLRPGGRIGVTVFSTPDRNAFLSMPIQILSRWADPEGAAPPPPPGAPGPFALGKPGRIQSFLHEARFEGIRVESVASPLRMPSLDELMRFYHETLRDVVQALPPARQQEAWDDVARAVSGFIGPASSGAPCEILVASGRRR